MAIEILPDADEIHLACQPAYLKTLVAPLDDMWAAFAAMANPYALVVDDRVAGCCTVNEERELHQFYLHPEFEDRGELILASLVDQMDIVSAVPSTVDPAFLSLTLSIGHSSDTVALMYQHVLEPQGSALTGLRIATTADHADAVAFAKAATGMPDEFLVPYLSERIERAELFLHEVSGAIHATGECRVDQTHLGHAHLGMIVGIDHRSRGVGSQLLNALVAECQRRDLRPLCSTESTNLAARRVIHKIGFRSRHRVFRVKFGTSDSES
jgi:GNAT superfamily N-acetyltransferase